MVKCGLTRKMEFEPAYYRSTNEKEVYGLALVQDSLFQLPSTEGDTTKLKMDGTEDHLRMITHETMKREFPTLKTLKPKWLAAIYKKWC